MTQPPTIPKQIVLPESQDYNLLRSEGLRYIENLASDLWTDYNAHDPGITILEVLCYAITELGYRTGFDIKDLLTAPDGRIPDNQCFYTAKNILTVNPLTARDYRKLLIDLPEVQNAWMLSDYADVGQEVAFYADCARDRLSIDDGTAVIPPDHEIHLSGLYKTVLDLESDPRWGDLNTSAISWRIPDGDIQDQVVTLLFGYLEQADRDDYEAILAALTGSGYAAAIQDISLPPRKTDLHHWECDLTVTYVKGGADLSAMIRLIIRMDALSARNDLQSADTYLQALFTPDFIHDRFTDYHAKRLLTANTLEKAKATLMAHRNLCEDYRDLVTVTDEDIALCADIDVSRDADIEEISADIFYAIQEYFSPSLHFYTLADLLGRGIPVDEIFDGPVLSHGFIDNTELDQAQLRQVIHTSDLVNLIMGLEGVRAVRNLVLTRYDQDGEHRLPSEAWCLSIPAGHKPVLNTDRSKLIFYKGKIPLRAQIAEIRDTLQYLQAIHEKNKLYGTQDDLPVPRGVYHDLEDYYSVQNDLPQTYGTGIAGLPASAGPERTAEARQLKAYLLFYDQLLADFFSQLNGVKRLLSIDATLVQSYFTQYLGEAAPPQYQDGVKGVTDLYTDPSAMQSLMTAADVDGAAWRNLVETEQTFYDRRNTFLDHLLARFDVSFNDYVLMMYQVNFDLQQSEAVSNAGILSAKINFLKDYPDISSNRGRAMDYCPVLTDASGFPVLDAATNLPELDKAALWSPDNISGLEKRASLFSAIPLPTESRLSYFLFCHSMADITGQGPDSDPPYSFAFFDEKGNAILQSVKTDYASKTEAAADASRLTTGLADTRYYYAQKQADDTYKLFVTDDPGNKTNLIATDGETYATLADANKAKNALAKFFGAPCGREGLYLVEHILLRPREAYHPRPFIFLLRTETHAVDDEGNDILVSRFAFYLLDAGNHILLGSLRTDYPDALSAGQAADALAPRLSVTQAWQARPQSDGTYQLFLSGGSPSDPNAPAVAVAIAPSAYPTAEEATAAIAGLTRLFAATPLVTGFYTEGTALPAVAAVPQVPDFNLMEVCLGKECHFCGEQDPYSFRASVVLPGEPARFRNILFRRYFEDLIRTEAPAETSLKICWVNNTLLRQFEIAWKAWVEALAEYTTDPSADPLLAALKTANDNLIYILQHLYSEYPVATLHDCEESQQTNIVILGSTVLGTYKK
jgi:hypothetical protein